MSAFVDLMERTAAVLAEFAEPESPGSLKWNGAAYVTAGPVKFDAYAAKWWATLITIAEMIRAQDGPLSSAQRSYLDRLLFGGMGSFSDFALPRSLGPEAEKGNQELKTLRRAMLEQLQRRA